MYFLSQYKKLLLASCVSYQQAPDELTGNKVETPLDATQALKNLKAELEATQKGPFSDEIKLVNYTKILTQLDEISGDDEDDDEDEAFKERIEKQIYAILERKHQAAQSALDAALAKLDANIDPEILKSISYSKTEYQMTELSPDASLSDIIDELQKKIDYLEGQLAILTTNIHIYENPNNKEERVKALETAFGEIDEKNKKDLIGQDVENLRIGDIYALKARGVDLATIFLAPAKSSKDIQVQDAFVVNFGGNSEAHNLLGAGDVLPITEVSQISVNGEIGERRVSPRPGYYSLSTGKYLPIYDGYKIKILEKKPLEQEQQKSYETAFQSRFVEVRGDDLKILLKKHLEQAENTGDIVFETESDQKIIEGILTEFGLSLDTNGKILFTPERDKAFLIAALDDFSGIKTDLVQYIQEHASDISENENGQYLTLDISKYSPFLISQALKSWNISGLKYDETSGTLSVEGDKKLKDVFFGNVEYTGTGTKHLRYMPELQHASSETGVPMGAIIKLIYHENAGWNPTIKAPGSSAYGLGQMIDGTWNTFGAGLNRNNPGDQLLATARYMLHIKNIKDCPWEHVLAYYNTGEGIRNISAGTLQSYISKNPAITRLAPGRITTSQEYFTAAVAYYNDISYEQAAKTI